MADSNSWIWSEEHKNYYCVLYDLNGNMVYKWADTRPRADSGANHMETGNYIRGTDGMHEQLDSSYIVRNDARRFFRRGRLFSILFSEACGDTANMQDNENITVVKLGGKVYTQIRRFVVSESNGHCNACPIFTYGNRATTKPGCRAGEHAVIYYKSLQSPIQLPNETGVTKLPIGVMPPSVDQQAMNTASRVRFGKVYPIEWNVKAKDLGKVANEDMERLIAYYNEELNR